MKELYKNFKIYSLVEKNFVRRLDCLLFLIYKRILFWLFLLDKNICWIDEFYLFSIWLANKSEPNKLLQPDYWSPD
jgi:hypothetical protein